jgi:hypothetical protein
MLHTTGNMLSGQAARPQPSSFLDDLSARLANAASDIHGITSNAEAIADGVFGASPKAECGQMVDAPKPYSRVEGILQQVSAIDSALSVLRAQVDRLRGL